MRFWKENTLFSGIGALLALGLLLFWGSLGNTLEAESYLGVRALSHPLFELAPFWGKGAMALFLFLFLGTWRSNFPSPQKPFFQCVFGALTLFSAFLYAGNAWGIACGGLFFLLFLFFFLFREKHKGGVLFSGERVESFFWILLLTLFNSFIYQEGTNFLFAGGRVSLLFFLFPFAGLLLKGKEERKLYMRRLLLVFFLLLLVHLFLGLGFDLLALSNFSILFLFLFGELSLALAARGLFPGKKNFSLLVLLFFLLFHRFFPVPGMTDFLSALAAFLFFIAADNIDPITIFFRKKVLERMEHEKIFSYSFRGYQAQAWTCGAFVFMLFTGGRFLFTETALILLLFLFAFFRRKLSILSFLPAKSYIPEFVLGAVFMILAGIFHKSLLFPASTLSAFTLSLAILYTGKWIAEGHKFGEKEKHAFPFYAGSFFLLFAGELFLLYNQTAGTGLLSFFLAIWGGILLAASPFSTRKFRPFTGGLLLFAALFVLLIPSSLLPSPHWTPGAIHGGILAFALTSFYYMLKDNYIKEGK